MSLPAAMTTGKGSFACSAWVRVAHGSPSGLMELVKSNLSIVAPTYCVMLVLRSDITRPASRLMEPAATMLTVPALLGTTLLTSVVLRTRFPLSAARSKVAGSSSPTVPGLTFDAMRMPPALCTKSPGIDSGETVGAVTSPVMLVSETPLPGP